MTTRWRLRQVTPKPTYPRHPPPDTSREGPYAGHPTLRRLPGEPSTSRWTLGWPGARITAPRRIQARKDPGP